MDPKAIIDSYGADVVRYLPRRQRTDVASELRSLLDDELGDRAASAGRSADSALAMELLTDFGRPQEVADRYRTAGFTIIRPSDAPRFTWLALGGVALIWVVTLAAYLLGITPVIGWDYGADAWWGRLTAWWLGPGIGALWWPGLMITYTLIGALVERRRESTWKAWAPASPRAIDRDLVSRPATVAALGAWLLGATVVIALPWLDSWLPGLPAPVLDALALDPGFLTQRAPWVLLAWAASFALWVVVLIGGALDHQHAARSRRAGSRDRRPSAVVGARWAGVRLGGSGRYDQVPLHRARYRLGDRRVCRLSAKLVDIEGHTDPGLTPRCS